MEASGVDKLFRKRPSEQWQARLSVADLFHQMQVKQGQGAELRDLEARTDIFLQRNLFHEAMIQEASCQPSCLAPAIEGNRCVTLMKWTREVFINCIQILYSGESPARLNPRLPQVLTEFDDLSWQVFYSVPNRSVAASQKSATSSSKSSNNICRSLGPLAAAKPGS